MSSNERIKLTLEVIYREADNNDIEIEKIPLIITIGDREEKANTLAVRRNQKVKTIKKQEAPQKKPGHYREHAGYKKSS